MLDKSAFRHAMSHLPTAVTIVTSSGSCGAAACTVSSVCSVTDDPPTLLVCINRASNNNSVIRNNGSLCVSILSGEQSNIAMQCANHQASVGERLALFDTDVLVTGSPAVVDSVCCLDCRVDNIVESGTHSVFFCQVLSSKAFVGKDALVYYCRNYHRVS